MRIPLALFVSAVLLFLSAVHVYWAAGGQRWMDLVLPQRAGARVFTPTAWMTLMVALGLLAAAGVVLAAGVPDRVTAIPSAPRRVLVGVLALVFTLRAVGDARLVGLFRKEKGTSFAYWDARLFTPLCLLLAAACALLTR